ncbi:MAG: hypothetical protein LHV69_07800 [Elusimicrobia bacterium]|nr:hypothetical protein [Candidatus Obscuribacterium magneticum]
MKSQICASIGLILFILGGVIGCKSRGVDRLIGGNELSPIEANRADVETGEISPNGRDSLSLVFHSNLNGTADDGFGNLSDVALRLKVHVKNSRADIAIDWPAASRSGVGEGVCVLSGKSYEITFKKVTLSLPIPYTKTTNGITVTFYDGDPIDYSGRILITAGEATMVMEALDGSRITLKGDVRKNTKA